jgi:hypothetical protein
MGCSMKVLVVHEYITRGQQCGTMWIGASGGSRLVRDVNVSNATAAMATFSLPANECGLRSREEARSKNTQYSLMLSSARQIGQHTRFMSCPIAAT